MRSSKILALVFIAVVVSAIVLGATSRVLNAQGAVQDQGIAEKLDAIANTQKAILDDLASIKEELRIIKIRVTQTQ